MGRTLPEPRPRSWSRDEYYRAGELGIFRPDERLELIDGQIVAKMSPVGSPHRFTVHQVAAALESAFGEGFYVEVQSPLTMSDETEPEPDVLVAIGTVFDYQDRHPSPADIRLIVEVSDSSILFDRGKKAMVYAAAGIQEYWIVNLGARTIEVHRDPNPGGYRNISILHEAESITPLFAPAASISIQSLFPIQTQR
jgi:Uma2 family endonuclease